MSEATLTQCPTCGKYIAGKCECAKPEVKEEAKPAKKKKA